MMLRCAICSWPDAPTNVRDVAHAQDLLVSHHNAVHGRPPGGHWPPYDNSAAHAEAARRYAALQLGPVEHDYTPAGGLHFPLLARLRAWWNRPRCLCPRPTAVLPPLHGGYRPHPQPPQVVCPRHPERVAPRMASRPPQPPQPTRRKGTW